MIDVNETAQRVPFGIDFPGSLSSPDILAPAIMPVTPLKSTPNTMANEFSESVV